MWMKHIVTSSHHIFNLLGEKLIASCGKYYNITWSHDTELPCSFLHIFFTYYLICYIILLFLITLSIRRFLQYFCYSSNLFSFVYDSIFPEDILSIYPYRYLLFIICYGLSLSPTDIPKIDKLKSPIPLNVTAFGSRVITDKI